jgi:hypothetical protein
VAVAVAVVVIVILILSRSSSPLCSPIPLKPCHYHQPRQSLRSLTLPKRCHCHPHLPPSPTVPCVHLPDFHCRQFVRRCHHHQHQRHRPLNPHDLLLCPLPTPLPPPLPPLYAMFPPHSQHPTLCTGRPRQEVPLPPLPRLPTFPSLQYSCDLRPSSTMTPHKSPKIIQMRRCRRRRRSGGYLGRACHRS